MLLGFPKLYWVIILAQHQSPSCQAIGSRERCLFAGSKQCEQRLVVRDQTELSSIEELMKLLKAENYSKSLFMNLTVLSLCLTECLWDIGNWSLTAIRIAVKKYSTKSNLWSITRDAQYLRPVIVNRYTVFTQPFLKLFKSFQFLLAPIPLSALPHEPM